MSRFVLNPRPCGFSLSILITHKKISTFSASLPKYQHSPPAFQSDRTVILLCTQKLRYMENGWYNKYCTASRPAYFYHRQPLYIFFYHIRNFDFKFTFCGANQINKLLHRKIHICNRKIMQLFGHRR